MHVNAFKVDDFEYTHERQAFRRLCQRLAEQSSDQIVTIIGNATLPDVEVPIPGQDKTRTYYSVSPDVIIMKKDAVLIVEMKSHPGLVSFPKEDEDLWKQPWTASQNGKTTIINEDSRHTPYQQITDNGKAVIGFLNEYINPAASEESKGSYWYKAMKVLLFTADNVSFDSPPDSRWRNTTIATLEPTDNPTFDITTLIADTTTPPIHYKEDPRTRIHISAETVEIILQKLGAQSFDFQPEQIESELTENDQHIAHDYGYAGVIHVGTNLIEREINESTQISIPEKYKTGPLPLRVIRYYSHCLHLLAKQDSTVFLNRPDQVFVIRGIEEGIFHGNGSFSIPAETIPDRFITPDGRFTYGYFPLVVENVWNGRINYNAMPLFMRDVKVSSQEDGYVCQSLSDNELLINRSALRRFTVYKQMTEEELDTAIRELEEVDELPQRIKNVLESIGIHWNDAFTRLGALNLDNLQVGVLPIAFLFQSSSGFYTRLVKDLSVIMSSWSKPAEGDRDLAWQLLEGLGNKPISIDWKPAPITALQSNYEQSRAVALALNKENPIQVISGPPGTGKSQVIQNIILNANLSGEKVLFASRNNKAVDVVVDRLNGGIFNFPLVFRTGNNNQNQAFASLLRNSEQLPTEELTALRQEEPVLRGELRQMTGKLEQIQQSIEAAQKAREKLDHSEQLLEQLRDENEDLFMLTNWYDLAEGDLKLDLWKKLRVAFELDTAAGKGFLSRAVTSLTRGYGLNAVFDRSQYNRRLFEAFQSQLKQKLPSELISLLGDEFIANAGSDIIGIIDKLDAIGRSYSESLNVLRDFNEEQTLKDWAAGEDLKIPTSRRFMDLIWARKHDSSILSDLLDLLENYRSTKSFDRVLELFPCCATTTLSAGNKIPMTRELFDLAIIDEASQTDVVSSLPILFRAKRAVVIGDEMQLRPVATLSDEINQALMDGYGLVKDSEKSFDYKESSILDIANTRYTESGGRRILLRDHFRSHPDIIGFSNRCFYNAALRIRTESENRQGVFFHDVQGPATPRWQNASEIAFIVDHVRSLLERGIQHRDIGIVTPFRGQADSVVSRLRETNLYQSEGGALTVSTAHGYQGDEKDFMIFSLVVSENMPENSILWVHNIATYSKNLLNVALTRAKKELHIVGSREVCITAGGLLRELVAHCDRCAR